MTSAREIAVETLTASLPEGSPLMFKSIERAAFHGKHSIVAHLTMFDGRPAIARFNSWAMGWSIGWDDLPGGAASLEGGAWRRVLEAPSQPTGEAV